MAMRFEKLARNILAYASSRSGYVEDNVRLAWSFTRASADLSERTREVLADRARRKARGGLLAKPVVGTANSYSRGRCHFSLSCFSRFHG